MAKKKKQRKVKKLKQGGIKYDQGKARFDLIPASCEAGVALVFTFGAEKYGDRNWQNGLYVTRLLAAAARHHNLIKKGETNDPESGLPHAYHAAVNLYMAQWMIENKPEFDDRETL